MKYLVDKRLILKYSTACSSFNESLGIFIKKSTFQSFFIRSSATNIKRNWHPNLKKYIFYTRVYHLCCTVMCTKTTHQPHNPIKHRVKYLYKSNTEKNVYTTIFYLPWDTFLDTHIISFDVIFSVAVALLAIKWTQ